VKAHNQGGGKREEEERKKEKKRKEAILCTAHIFQEVKECKCTKHVTWETTLHVAQILNTEWLQNHIP